MWDHFTSEGRQTCLCLTNAPAPPSVCAPRCVSDVWSLFMKCAGEMVFVFDPLSRPVYPPLQTQDSW